MAFKDILVHVDHSTACAARVDAALALAQTHDAHLTGLYVVEIFTVPAYAEVPIGREVIEEAQRAMWARADEAKASFEAAAARAGTNAEWRSLEGELVGTLSEQGRYFDVVVVGQSNPDDAEDVSAGLADRLVLEMGRPVLVIPYIGTHEKIGERVLVAWNARREAVRAINDALPLLQNAAKVDVMVINPSGVEGDLPAADISLHLARHNVKAEAQSITAEDIDAGNLLLSRAADADTDLIVMGAYGHSRFRETVLGGVTRHMLRHMTVPVFMSH